MKKKDMLETLCRIGEGISIMFGSSCEVVIHNLDSPDRGIVAIYNGHVTGRKVGDSLSILGLKNLRQGKITNDLINYESKTKDGRLIKSSSFYISDTDYSFILGINFDYTNLKMADLSIQGLIATADHIEDCFPENSNNFIDDVFCEVTDSIGKPVALMNKDDRLKAIKLLDERGVFLMQKAIPTIAEKLNVSRYTIYNYLKILGSENSNNQKS